jgi:hypothetical protein
MSIVTADIAFLFPSFYAMIETRLKRMLEFMKSDCFTFVVTGEHFESTVAEIILISPVICDILRRDVGTHSFVLSFFRSFVIQYRIERFSFDSWICSIV